MDVYRSSQRECEKAGILFTCSAHCQEMKYLDLVDLNILLGNMIDNAIEAVKKLPEEQMIIDAQYPVFRLHILIHVPAQRTVAE